jgi:hypothetical protein
VSADDAAGSRQIAQQIDRVAAADEAHEVDRLAV